MFDSPLIYILPGTLGSQNIRVKYQDVEVTNKASKSRYDVSSFYF